jgi:hypothetical protein
VVHLDVLGQLLTLSEREAEELRGAAESDAGRSTARRDLSLLLERALETGTTIALSRAEARELLTLVSSGGLSSNLDLLRQALVHALEDPGAQGQGA